MTSRHAAPSAACSQFVRIAGAIGLAGIVVQVFALLATPLIRPDVSLLRDGLSHYAIGPGAGLQETGFVALAVACAAIGMGLLAIGAESRAAGLLLLLAAIGFAGLALFPMGQGGPMTPIGDLHLTAGTIGVVLQFAAALAMLARPGSCAALGVSRSAGWLLAALAGLAAAGIQLAIWTPGLGLPEGLLARLAIVPLLAWWAIVALALLRGNPRPATETSQGT